MTRSENRERKYFFVIKKEGGVKPKRKQRWTKKWKNFNFEISFGDGFAVLRFGNKIKLGRSY